MTQQDKAALFDAIRALCGYVEDGSSTSVLLSQDDACKDWLVKVGNVSFHGTSPGDAINNAIIGLEGGK